MNFLRGDFTLSISRLDDGDLVWYVSMFTAVIPFK